MFCHLFWGGFLICFWNDANFQSHYWLSVHTDRMWARHQLAFHSSTVKAGRYIYCATLSRRVGESCSQHSKPWCKRWIFGAIFFLSLCQAWCSGAWLAPLSNVYRLRFDRKEASSGSFFFFSANTSHTPNVRTIIRFYCPRHWGCRKPWECSRYGMKCSAVWLNALPSRIPQIFKWRTTFKYSGTPIVIQLLYMGCSWELQVNAPEGKEMLEHNVLLAFVQFWCSQWLSQQFLSTTGATCYNF